VLLLGLGGGSVARAVRALDAEAEIVGVERDGQVVRLAREHLDLDGLGLDLVIADARDFLRHDGRRFDLIVEDLFVGPPRSVRKPAWLLGEGYPLMRRRLRARGLIVSNTIHEMPAVVRALRPLGGRIVSLDVRDHWNRIVVCGRRLARPATIRRLLHGQPALRRLLSRIAVRSRWRPSSRPAGSRRAPPGSASRPRPGSPRRDPP
jgi:SAM-dependent methyltransferase